MAKPRQTVDTKRRIPRQARATETVETILEGAAQVLEAGGLAAFTACLGARLVYLQVFQSSHLSALAQAYASTGYDPAL